MSSNVDIYIFISYIYIMKKKVLNALIKLSQMPSITEIERQSGLKKGTLSRVLSGERNLTDKHIEKLIPVLKLYGFKS